MLCLLCVSSYLKHWWSLNFFVLHYAVLFIWWKPLPIKMPLFALICEEPVDHWLIIYLFIYLFQIKSTRRGKWGTDFFEKVIIRFWVIFHLQRSMSLSIHSISRPLLISSTLFIVNSYFWNYISTLLRPHSITGLLILLHVLSLNFFLYRNSLEN